MVKPQPITLSAEEAKRYTERVYAQGLRYKPRLLTLIAVPVFAAVEKVFFRRSSTKSSLWDAPKTETHKDGSITVKPSSEGYIKANQDFHSYMTIGFGRGVFLSMLVMGAVTGGAISMPLALAGMAIGGLVSHLIDQKQYTKRIAKEDEQIKQRYELAKQVRAETLMERGHFQQRSPQPSKGREQEVAQELKSDWVKTHGQKQQAARSRV